jgi:hypothetical protein
MIKLIKFEKAFVMITNRVLIVNKDKGRAGVLKHISDSAQILQGSELILDTLNSKFLAQNFEFCENYSDFCESSPKFLKFIKNRFFFITFDRIEILG